MEEILNGIISTQINFSTVINVVLIYLTLLWVAISFWVGVDASKRYKNRVVAIGFFILVFILNIPALVFYLIVRPEKEEDNVFFFHGEEGNQSGINVPIVNFKGNDGFVVSLQLKIGNPNLESKDKNDMKIKIDFDTNDSNMEIVKQEDKKKDEIVVEKKQKIRGEQLKNKAKEKANLVKNSSKKIFKKVNLKQFSKK